MNSSRSGVPIWVTVVLVIIALAVAVGAVAAGVIESGKKPAVKAAATPAARHVEPNYPASPATSGSTVTALAVPTPVTVPAPKHVEPPADRSTVEAPAPVLQPPATALQAPVKPPRRECPSGAVSARLTSVTFNVENPSPYDIDITARGILTNGTSSPIGVGEHDIPDFRGLDDRGQAIVIELYGTYDWAPPPGQPSMGEFVLEPGASVAFTAIDHTWKSTVRNVKYWYSAAIPGSVLLYFPSPLSGCEVRGQTPAEGAPVANTFAG